MNASAVILFSMIAVCAVVSGLPVLDDFQPKEILTAGKERPQDSEILLSDISEEVGVRLPRATCDLLSISLSSVSLNHSACAAHCIAMMKGFRGGRCKDGVCHCRK